MEQSSLYVVRIGYKGRRTTFSLETPNRATAGRKAMAIYQDIAANGWDNAFARAKKLVEKGSPIALGEYLCQAQKYLQVRPKTFAAYCAVLRRIAADIAGLRPDNTRFDCQSGGREAWRARVEAIKLELLTPKNIRDWCNKFLERAKGDPVKLKAARNSVASFVRAGKALFSQEVLKNIEGIKRSPFADIQVKQPPLRYRSKIDFEKLLRAASTELAFENRELFKIFLLAACAGLRRSEIDVLEWGALHFKENFIRIETTRFFEGKSESSHDDVYLDPEITALFRAFYTERKGNFVVQSSLAPKSGSNYEYYRCQGLFEKLIAWLRLRGVDTKSPIHDLRREYGSQLAKTHGIFVASRALRHSSVQTTEKFYASQKERVSLGLGHLFTRPENVIDIEPNQASG
jgi:integrase